MTLPDPPGDLDEEDMEEIRRRFLQSILQKREEALLYRRYFDYQMKEDGEIGRRLHEDLAVAAMCYHDELRPYRDDDPGEFPDMKALKENVRKSEGHVADDPDTPARRFAMFIDALEGSAHRLGFTESGVNA